MVIYLNSIERFGPGIRKACISPPRSLFLAIGKEVAFNEKNIKPGRDNTHMDLDKLDKIFWLGLAAALIILYLWLKSVFG